MRLPLWSKAQVRLMARDRESDDADWALTKRRCRTRVLFGRVGERACRGRWVPRSPGSAPTRFSPRPDFRVGARETAHATRVCRGG